MKTLLLIRHAKSSWDSADLPDFKRPLNKRGAHDAPMMAKRLHKKEIAIDRFITSPAKRARKTAEAFMEVYDRKEKEMVEAPSLYEGSVADFYSVIEALDDGDVSVAVFAHNPGITEFVNSLECSPVYNMPTCAVFALKIKTAHWKELRFSEKEFLFFDYPENED
jgi:phosphohistidine phosphatase